MKSRALIFFVTVLFASFFTQAQEGNWPPPLEGRWDINISSSGKQYPAWLEVRHSGINTLVGRIMIISGSARPISKINYTNGKFNFSIPPQWDKSELDVHVSGIMAGDSLRGSIQQVDGKTYSWVGVRAPSLKREKPVQWGAPITLFNGKDIKGWHTEGDNQWIAEDGMLRSPKSGSNLITDKSFTDFKLHIEFRYPKGSNSGIYLRGRYEVQVADSKGMEPWDDQFSGIYGVVAPNEMVAKDPGEWQSFDITLIGRRVTIVANGVAVITDQVIPGITGGAMDSNEGEPGPLLIQGDHGPVDYRNIILTPAK
jgi:hypothetical protein